jgi:hypothetical protein
VVGVNAPSSGPPAAWLKTTGRKPVAAFDAEMQSGAIVFFFDLGAVPAPTVFRLPFGVQAGNAIEFETRIGGRTIRKRFPLGKMSFTPS